MKIENKFKVQEGIEMTKSRVLRNTVACKCRGVPCSVRVPNVARYIILTSQYTANRIRNQANYGNPATTSLYGNIAIMQERVNNLIRLR